MSPLAILLTIIVGSFVVTCALLYQRSRNDDKQALQESEKRRKDADARFQATKAKMGNRLEAMRGGRANRTTAPLNRRAGK